MKNILMKIPIFFAGFFSFFGGEELAYKKDEAKMNAIVNHSIKQLSKRYKVIPIGRGGGNEDNKSRSEYVAFQLYEKLSKDEARVLIIEIVELFLCNINSNKEIAPYLYNIPFTYENLEFRVFLYDKDGSDLYHPNLGLVSLTRIGTINFVTYKDESLDYAYNVEEPYEEAYRIATNREYPKNVQPPQNTSGAASQNHDK